MARYRGITIDFFTSEDIVALTPLARLLYIGLWHEADREGRMRWHPQTFKWKYLPGDNVEIHELCAELLRGGLVRVYEVDAQDYGWIPRFRAHQHINSHEAASKLPAPPQMHMHAHASTQMHMHARASTQMHVGSEHEHEHEHERESLTSPIGEVRAEISAPATAEPAKKGCGIGDCPHQRVLALWAEVLPELPQHKKWTEARCAHLRARWREAAAEQKWADTEAGLAYMRGLFKYIRQSPFLMGRAPPRPNRSPFVLDLSWLIQPEHWANVIEGKYHNEVDT